MVSNSSSKPSPLPKKSLEKKLNAAQRSPSPPIKGKEVSRYEFDSKAVPKGLRTDREKKKMFVKKPGVELESENHQPGADATSSERHLERVRASGKSNSKPRSRIDHSSEAQEAGKPKDATIGDEELQQTEADTPQEVRQTQEHVKQTRESSPVEEPENNNVKTQEFALETLEQAKTPEEQNMNSTLERAASDEDPKRNEEGLDEEKLKPSEVGGSTSAPPAEEEQKLANLEPDTSLSLGLSGSHRVKRVRSVQSFSQAETFSHGITTSLSLSCSHAFTHNPSCSLTQTSHDNNQEFSSASQPVYQEPGGEGMRLPKAHPKPSLYRKQTRNGGISRSAGSNRARPSCTPGMVTVREIVSDPVPLVAQRLQDSSPELIEELKNSVRDLLERSDRKEEFLQLQSILQSRTDLVDEVLVTCHRAQLEVLVALKTGIRAFLNQEHQSKALVEIFLNQRCRKAQCSSQLPNDNCECQLCTQGNGFCNACMCVVCSTFDFEQNTCGWVGCDFCIHWCHTDCGLRKSYIKPGPAVNGSPGTSEMQIHCLACGKASELFGFVKDVFTSCAETWNRAQLCKELDCVKRIYQGSEDLRGKQLCWKAGQLMSKLESSNLDVGEACKSMLRFFEDGTINPLEEEGSQGGGGGGAAGGGAAAAAASIIERASMALQSYDRVLEEKRSDAAEMQYERARKRAEIEELESIVRIKQAEAKMFQARADEAAREAEGLRRIVQAKRVKVEEEYAAKKSKLQLLEAEEKRKRKFESLKMLESGSCSFEVMRKVMGDLQGLLSSMEAAKRFKAPEDESSVDKYVQRYLQQSSC